ncbi:MAG: Pycsar system effector family protein [Pseudomonadota bacterium]
MTTDDRLSHLDALPFDQDIGSKEQMSVDQLTRSRLQFALGQNAAIVQQTQFADAKAATLLALTGVLAYGLTADAVSFPAPVLGGLFVLTCAVIGLCLVTLTPRVPSGNGNALYRTDRFSWPALTDTAYDADTHATFLRTAQASQLVMAVARSNAAIAKVLARKYAILRIAMLAALLDLAAIMVAAGLEMAGVIG